MLSPTNFRLSIPDNTNIVIDCSVCHLKLDVLGENIPRFIPSCGHMVCDNCTDSHCNKLCPLCSSSPPSEKVMMEDQSKVGDKNPTNLTIPHSRMCTNMCDETNTVELFCVQCSTYYCKECYDTHKKFTAFKLHSSKPLNSVTQSAAYCCQEHPTYPRNLVCLHPTCQSNDYLVCHMCVKFGTHKGHRTQSIANVAEFYRFNLADNTRVLQSMIHDATILSNQVQTVTLAIRNDNNTESKDSEDSDIVIELSSEDKVIAAIMEEHNRTIKLLNAQTNDFIQQIRQVASQRINALYDQSTQLSTFIHNGSRILHAAQSLMNENMTNNQTIILQYDTIQEELTKAIATTMTPHPVHTAEIHTNYDLKPLTTIIPQFVIQSDYGKSSSTNHLPTSMKKGRISTGLLMNKDKLSITLSYRDYTIDVYYGVLSTHILTRNMNDSVTYTCTIPIHYNPYNCQFRYILGWGSESIVLEQSKQVKNIIGLYIDESKMNVLQSYNEMIHTSENIPKMSVFDKNYHSQSQLLFESTYHKLIGTIHMKVKVNERIVVDQICFNNIVIEEELFPCVYIHNQTYEPNGSIDFNLPLFATTKR